MEFFSIGETTWNAVKAALGSQEGDRPAKMPCKWKQEAKRSYHTLIQRLLVSAAFPQKAGGKPEEKFTLVKYQLLKWQIHWP